MGSDQLIKEFYNKDGYIVLRSFFNDDEVKSLKEMTSGFIDEVATKLSGRDINWIDGVVNSIHCVHKFPDSALYKRFVLSKKISQMAEFLLDDEPEIRASELFLKPAGVGLRSPMHQDDYYWCVTGHNALTFWIAIDPAGYGNGGIKYIPGSQKLGLLEHIDSHAPGSSQTVADQELLEQARYECPEILPGDVLVHHALTIHGSDANRGTYSRKGLTVQIKGRNSNYDLERKRHYEYRLQEQLSQRSRSSK